VTAAWFLIEIYADPSLLPRVEAHVKRAQLPRGADTPELVRFDVDKLCKSPLLQSIYAETLRLRVALLINRTPVHSDFELGGWRFRKGRMIAMSTFTAGTNEAVWNTGSKGDYHPLEEFWADRFLVPVKTQGEMEKHGVGDGDAPREFSTTGLSGAWIPYGGGPFMCPGRHFAKQEMLGSFALFFSCFEVELMLGQDRKIRTPGPDMKFFGLGALPPKEKVPYRIRRRGNT
jgi:cytochrome P450